MIPVILYFIFFAVLLLITIKKPAFILGGMLSIYVLEQLTAASHPYFAFNPKLTNLMIGGGVVFALLVANLKKTEKNAPKFMIIMLALSLYIYAGTSITWAPNFSKSLSHVDQALPYLILYLFLATWLLSSLDDYRTLYKSIIIVGSVLLALLLISGKLEVGGVRIPWILDEYGQAQKQNYLEIAKLSGIVMLVSLLSNVGDGHKIWRIVKWLIAILCIAVSIKSGARGQTILALVVLGVFLPLKYPLTKSKNLGFLLGLIPVLIYMFVFFLETYWGDSDRWSSGMLTQNAEGRIDTASALLGVWVAGDPFTLFFGLGNSSSYQIIGTYPHIVPAEILAEEGLLGFSLFIMVIFVYFKSLFSLYKKYSSSPSIKGIVLPLGAMFIYSFLLTFKQGSLLGSIQLFYFGSMILILKMLTKRHHSSEG